MESICIWFSNNKKVNWKQSKRTLAGNIQFALNNTYIIKCELCMITSEKVNKSDVLHLALLNFLERY